MNLIWFSERVGRARQFNLTHPATLVVLAALVVELLLCPPDRRGWAVLGSVLGLALLWLVRDIATGTTSGLLPFGASILGFGASFVAVRPLSRPQRAVAGQFVSGLGIAGATLGFGAGHVHDVTNESDQQALSLHVYSPALTSMTFYEVAGDQLVVREVAWTDDGSGEFEDATMKQALQTQRGGVAAVSR